MPQTTSSKVEQDIHILISNIKNRIQMTERLTEYITKSCKPSIEVDNLTSSMRYLINDARRTLHSAVDYLKKIPYLANTEALSLKTLVSSTAEAALLVLDKRVIDSLMIAQVKGIISREKHKVLMKEYVKKIYQSEDYEDKATTASASTDTDILQNICGRLVEMGNPYRPHFSQSAAEYKFSPTENTSTASQEILGKTLQYVGDQIKGGYLSRDSINVGVFYHEGAWVCANNRSLAVASISGVEPRLEIVFPTDDFISFYKKKQQQLTSTTKYQKKDADETFDPRLHTIYLENKENRQARQQQVSVPLSWRLTQPEARDDVAEERKQTHGTIGQTRFFREKYKKHTDERTEVSRETYKNDAEVDDDDAEEEIQVGDPCLYKPHS